MGLFSSKKRTVQTQQTKGTENSTSTSTPDVPNWLLDPAKRAASTISTLQQTDPNQFAPQVSDLQQKSFADAGNLTNSPLYGEAAGMARGVGDVSADQVQGQSLLTGLDQYYNPFKQQVLNPVMADYDAQAGQTRAAQAAQAARGQAFQGSRYGIQEGQTEGELARGRAATEGGLLGNMYTQATGLSSEDAARRQQAMMGNQSANLQAGLANQQAGFQKAGLLQGIGFQAGLGGVKTDAENAARQYPLEFARQTEGLLSGLGPSQYMGRTTTGTGETTSDMTGKTTETASPSTLASIGQVAQIAALFSDARVKQDVRTVGHDAKGRRWVSFAYVWAPWKRLLGVIAQEIQRTDPQAVLAGPGGVLMVDYGAL
jgi:hypothetical protein